MSRLADLARMACYFVRTRWLLRFRDRAALERHQARMLARFMQRELPRSPFYRRHAGQPLAQLPLSDKATMLKNFSDMNTAGITLEQASAVAMTAERSRDFRPDLGGISVGLSSGTQGPRGVFLTSAAEQARWAGIMLARALPAGMENRLLPGSAAIRIAFFLRAYGNIYQTLNSKRLDLRFYDLMAGLDAHLANLQLQQPDILVAPAQVLCALAELAAAGKLKLAPRRVISVAEVLERDEKKRVAAVFGTAVHELYQCTEGFLGFTCEHGTLHLNEEYVHIESEWLDEAHTRFVPIVTDFSRTTQHFVRYRLSDVLRLRQTPCPCGRANLALDGIEGRADDVLWLRKGEGGLAPMFSDMLRHALTTAEPAVSDYRIEQHGDRLLVAVQDEATRPAAEAALQALFARHQMTMPEFAAMPFATQAIHHKRRRIVCVTKPAILQAQGVAHA